MAHTMVRAVGGWERLLWVVALVTSILSYELVNYPTDRIVVLTTPLDAALPFVPLFAIPYLLYPLFLLVTLVLFGVRDWERFRALALTLIVASLSADLVYLSCQTFMPRPLVTGHDLGARLVRFVYAHDQPYSDVPSLHVAGSVLCALAYFRWRVRAGLYVLPLVLAILASTVLIRQHSLAGVAGGLLLAAFATWAAGKALALNAVHAATIHQR